MRKRFGVSFYKNIFIASLSLYFMVVAEVWAHSIYITAWIDGEQVCTESSFSTKSKARNSQVTVMNTAGELVHEGVTNTEGLVCFPLPPSPMQLVYVVNAGQGHRAETVLYEEDFPEVLGSSTERVESTSDIQASSSVSTQELEKLVRSAVRAEMQSQMASIRQGIVDLQMKKPGMVEIFGGIGWIVGLAGAGMMVAARRRKS